MHPFFLLHHLLGLYWFLLFHLLCNIVRSDPVAAGGRNSVVECLLPKQDVVGSNPIARSNFPNCLLSIPSFFVLTLLSPLIPLPINWPCGKLPAISDYLYNEREICMAYVTPREGEGPESLVNRFRASVQHSGILRELKDRRFFRSKAQKERLAAQRAARRRRRQNRRNR